MGPVTLHWLNASASHRILWLLLELDTPHTVKIHMRNPKTMLAPKELKEVHPLGKAPVIEDDGEVIPETGYIIEHLIDKYGKGTELEPKDTAEEKKVRLALHHSQSMIPAEMMLLVSDKIRTESPFLVKPVSNVIASRVEAGYSIQDIRKNLDYLENMLKMNGTGYFIGDHLTGADISYLFPVENAFTRDLHFIKKTEYPLLREWLKMVHERAALKKSYENVPDEDPSPKL